MTPKETRKLNKHLEAAAAKVVKWLSSQEYWHLEELINYLDKQYGVVYKSKQSYYELLEQAGLSWKKLKSVI